MAKSKTSRTAGLRVKQAPTPDTNIVRANGKVRFKKKQPVVLTQDLQEAAWRRIAASSELPVDGRQRIAMAIAMYQNMVASNRGSVPTKRLVRRMRGLIEKLTAGITTLGKDPVFLHSGLPWWRKRTGPLPSDMEAFQQVLSELDQVFVDAQDRMKMQSGRKSRGPLEVLIKTLNSIQADATQRSVRRSEKAGYLRPTNEFVILCVHQADHTLPLSRIEDVLTKCIAEHHEILRNDGFDTATCKYVPPTAGKSVKL
jgi:hypothetical protein